MAISILAKVNTDGVSTEYPYGNIRNNDGSNNGTPVDVNTYADFHQFFAALMAVAPLAYNNLPDNNTNGFQYLEALFMNIRRQQATKDEKGTAELATQAEVVAGTDDERIITPLELATYLGAWVTRSNIADLNVSGGAGIVKNGCLIEYKIIGKTMFMNYRFQVANTTAPTGFTLLIPDSKTVAHTNDIGTTCVCYSNTTPNIGYANTNLLAPTLIAIVPTGLVNGQNTVVTGSLTFEIS